MSTLIKTYDGDVYIIKEKEPKDLLSFIEKLDFIEMPNGSIVAKKSISTMQTYEDYQFQADQKQRHKKGQFLKNGDWNDSSGYIANAHLEEITGTTIKKLSHLLK